MTGPIPANQATAATPVVDPAHYFIAGTDTGVGKTRVTAGLLAAGKALGLHVAGMKPVASGGYMHDGRLVSSDALTIAASSGQSTPYEELNPYCLLEPVSPHIAAYRANIRPDIGTISAISCRIGSGQDLLLIEGAGGWYAPINESETMADLALALGAPVILVVGLKLGCLNHARLSLEAIRRSGIEFAGWIANGIDAEFAAPAENLATLERIFGGIALAILPYSIDARRDMIPLQAVAKHLIAHRGQRAADLNRP